MDATMKHTIGRPTKRIKARARAIKGAIEPSSACMAEVPSFNRASNPLSAQRTRFIYGVTVCQIDIRDR